MEASKKKERKMKEIKKEGKKEKRKRKMKGIKKKNESK